MDPEGEDVPEWYPLMRAARWLRVSPWELREQSIAWRDRALLAEQAEQAHADHVRKSARNTRLGGKTH